MEENLHKENKEAKPNVAPPDPPETCGGKNKPSNPPGQVGNWECIGGSWEWIPFIGE